MTGVRACVEEDIPQVARLYQRIFRPGETSPEPLKAYEGYLAEVFLRNPLRQPLLPALVYEEKGEFGGFLGVVPRRFVFRGREIQAAVSSHFMVDPAYRSRGAGLKLLNSFLSGPQELSFTDGSNDPSRLIWEWLGGESVFAQSLRWTWLLRPCAYAAMMTSRLFPGAAGLRRAVQSAVSPVDALAVKMPRSPLRRRVPTLESEELTCGKLAECLEHSGMPLRPAYNRESLEWLLCRAERMRERGDLQKVLLRTPQGDLAGWYLYYLKAGEKGEVIQFFATPKSLDGVLEHLLYHAWSHGAVALAGSMTQHMFTAFPDYGGFLWRRGRWMLVHSRRSELVHAFQQGQAFCSRLDGEWCNQYD